MQIKAAVRVRAFARIVTGGRKGGGATMNFEKRKDLLGGLKDMSREEIELILDTAVP